MFDHVGVNVENYARSRAFYEQALEPIGWGVVMAFDEWKACGFGRDGKPSFWVSQREPYGTGTHIAFAADDRWPFCYSITLTGAGIREQYHPTYYGAFVLDPDGNNVETVCHR